MTPPYFTWANAKVAKINEIKGDEALAILSRTTKLWESIALKHSPSGNIVTIENQPIQADLLYVESVFVSSGMNDNDDVFLPEELWPAIASIPNKPVDWEHDREQIIGHMTEAFPVDMNGKIIDASKHPLVHPSGLLHPSGLAPAQFDVVNKSVVYKWLFPEKAKQIVDDSEANEMFVSMEVWFSNFDYLLGNQVVKRTAETSFLDAHLRVNKGKGFFENKKIGRILRGMVFGGKGFVKIPANPRSLINDTSGYIQLMDIQGNKTLDYEVLKSGDCLTVITSSLDDKNRPVLILGQKENKIPNVKNGVEDSEDKLMEDTKMSEQLKELEAKIETLQSALELANTKIKEHEEADSAKAIKSLKSEVASKVEEIEKLQKQMADFEKMAEDHSKCESEMKNLQEQLDKATEALKEVVRAKNIATRMVVLAKEFKLDEKELENVKATICDMTDEEFAAYVEERKRFAESYIGNKEGTGKPEPKKVDPSKASAIDKLIADAEPEPAVIPSGSEGEDEWDKAAQDVASALGFVKKETE